MIRHQRLLGLSKPDVDILQTLLDRDIEVLNQVNKNQMRSWK